MTEERVDLPALRRELDQARRVAEASYALHTTLDLTELLGLILDAAKGGVDADRGTVFLLSSNGEELWSRVLSGDGDLEIRLPVGQGIAGIVAATGESLRIRDVRQDPRFDDSWDAKSGYVTKQLLTAPIQGRDGHVVGVFQLLNKLHGEFDDEDEAFLSALSVHAALAVENARLHRSAIEKERQDREIRLVQTVQRAYQPERLERQVGCMASAGLNQLCEDASGDYYDVFELADGRAAVVIGDVSGHGLGAALVMAQARALLHAFAPTSTGIPELLTLLNQHLARDMSAGRFMTLFVGIADPRMGKFQWNSAGHPPALLVRADGRLETLEPTGLVLGVLPETSYPPTEPVAMETGDVLLLYTDGATEAQDPQGEMLGEAGLARILTDLRHDEPGEILDGVRRALVTWTGGDDFDDDLTLVVLKRTGADLSSATPSP